MSKILVTGANGFLGSWLIRKLNSEGHDITILARQSSDLSELNGCRYQIQYGDVTDLNSLTTALVGHDVVFHLAGLIAYKKSQRSAMQKVNVEGTAHILKAVELCSIKEFVYLSSVVAIGAGRTCNEILNEKSDFLIHDLNLGYFETKHAAEKLVLDFHKKHSDKCQVTLVNPSTIYGPGDAKKGSRKTQIKVARGKFPFYSFGGVSIIDIEDCIEGLMLAWRHGRKGERYILSGENILIRDLFQMIAHVSNVKTPNICLPPWALKSLGKTGDFLTTLGINSSLSLENANTATLFHWFDNNKAKSELGLKTRPAEISISKSVNWMKENGLLND